MNILKSPKAALAAVLLALAFPYSAAAQSGAESATAAIKDGSGRNVGTASLTQTSAGVLLGLSLRGIAPGEHAVHIHNVGSCEAPSFESAGAHFNPGNAHHGMMAGTGHAGDMPNLHIPPNGVLDTELVNAAITLDKGKPSSVFHSGGTSIVIHAGKDDYATDPAGNAGNRIACGVITEAPASVGRSPTR